MNDAHGTERSHARRRPENVSRQVTGTRTGEGRNGNGAQTAGYRTAGTDRSRTQPAQQLPQSPQNRYAQPSQPTRQSPPAQPSRNVQSKQTGRAVPQQTGEGNRNAGYVPARRPETVRYVNGAARERIAQDRTDRPVRTAAPLTERSPERNAVRGSERGIAAAEETADRARQREQRKIARREEAAGRDMVRWEKQEEKEDAWQQDIIRVKGGIDRPLLILALILLALGTVMVLSASYPLAVRKGKDALYYAGRQFLFLALGFVMMLLGWKLPYEQRVMRRLMPIGAWLTAAALLVAVCFIGLSEGEAQRWIQIPGVPITVQPSEIMKLAEVMLLAMYADLMKEKMAGAEKRGMRYLYNVVLPGLLVGLSCGLVIIGKHLSGTMIIGVIGLCMVLTMVDRKCPSWWAPVTIAVLLLAAAAAYIIAVPYARTRFLGIFSPDSDRWQSMQSLYAVGSGGLFGVGVGQSRQKYSYLGAAHTDFIFAIWCEEFGFVGAVALICLFFAFLWRGYRVASRAKDTFSMLTAYGITTHFAVQIIGHMFVDTTYVNTGISLPFFSYGGSSLLIQMFELGLLLRISQHDYRSRAELEEAELRRRAGLD